MQLKSLVLTRVQWGERVGQFEGDVCFTEPKGEIKIMLTQEHISGILTLCADALVQSTREVANIMTANIINATAALPAPGESND